MSRLITAVLLFHTFFTVAHAWEHLSEPEFQSALNKDEAAIIVACE